MNLKHLFVKQCFLALAVLFVLGGCRQDGEGGIKEISEGLNIVASFSILADIANEVVGERGHVDYIIPIGEEPHGYEPLPSDYRKITDADVFYVNGLNLEGWLEKVVSNVTDTEIISLTDGVMTIPVVGDNKPDPHAWLNPKNVIRYVENLVEDLSARDPAGEEIYRENGADYVEKLLKLDAWIDEQIQLIPQQNRLIVVSENAFKYFGEAYGVETEGIWELNSHEEGTPQQFARLTQVIYKRQLPAVFVETTIDKRYMETVAREAGVEIAGTVYTDAVGLKGSGAETYIKMIEHNVKIFVEGLK